MTINVYRIYGEESPVPLTVFASDTNQAEEIYAEWILRHMPGRDDVPDTIEQCIDESFAEFPQLGEAAHEATLKEQGGVAYWLGHRGGWFVQPASAPRLGEIAPASSSVECYLFIYGENDVRLYVFANDRDHATELFQEWHKDTFGRPFEQIMFKQISRWTLTEDQVTLREEMDIGMVGISGYSLATGWHIYPPDHIMAGA